MQERAVCGYCLDCKWWESLGDIGDCKRFTRQYTKGDKAYLDIFVEGEVVECTLAVTPDFGCVQWEAKDG